MQQTADFLSQVSVQHQDANLGHQAADDEVVLQAPGGAENLTILEVRYEHIPVEPFREPLGSESSPKGAPGRR